MVSGCVSVRECFLCLYTTKELDSIGGSAAASFILIGKNVRYTCCFVMVCGCGVGLRFKQVGRKCGKSSK